MYEPLNEEEVVPVAGFLLYCNSYIADQYSSTTVAVSYY